MQIPGLHYGQQGGFGLAIWAKLYPSGDMSMDYILRQAKKGALR